MAYDDEEPKARKRTGPKARGKTAAADRAARAYLEDGLGWLKGYPESNQPSGAIVPWRYPGKDGPWLSLAVDRELLRTSFYTLRGARRKFPHALQRVVGDIMAWSGRMEERLRKVQSLVHDGERLYADEPSTPHAPAISSAEIAWLAWGDMTHRRPLEANRSHWGAALAQVGACLGAPTARRLGLEILLPLEEPSSLDPLRAILLDPAAYTAATEAGPVAEALKVLSQKKLTSEKVQPRVDALVQPPGASALAPQLIHFLMEEADPLARQLVLGCISPTVCAAWEAWWADVLASRRDAEAVLRFAALKVADQRVTKGLVGALRKSATHARESIPFDLSVPRLRRIVQQGLDRLPRPSAELVLRCLSRLPEEERIPGASKFVESATAFVHDLSERRRAELLSGLAERLESRPDALGRPGVRLAYARWVVEHVVEFDWSADEVPWEHRHAALDAALLICGTPKPKDWEESWASSWRISGSLEGYAAVCADGQRIAALVLEQPQVLTWDTATVAGTFACQRSAHSTEAKAPPFAALEDGPCNPEAWTAWAALSDRDHQGVTQLKKLSRTGSLRDELRQAAAAGIPPHELARFARLYATTKNARRGDWAQAAAAPGPTMVGNDEWRGMSAWIPESLHAAARELLGHSTAAAAAKALAPDVADPSQLAMEQTAIHARLQASELPEAKRSAMERRLRSLEERSATPPKLGRQTTENVVERLHRAAVRARFRRWSNALQECVLADLPDRARACIDLAQDRQADTVVANLSALPKETRALAYRLLSERAGPEPWDLREDPDNLAWRELAANNGVDLTRWFSGDPFDVPPPDEGAPLVFRLEDDPLEIMKMGLWFDTCLSPGDFNFFSTVANAADANKRVLVGRDEKGTAQVRCLFAITEEWHVLAFHVYSHERAKWAREAVQHVLRSLCSALGIEPAPRGKVPTLVANKWYDDGPQDVADQLVSLRPGGELAARVEAAPPSEAFALVSDTLGASIVEVALELVLGCEVFAKSAARTASFAPALLHRRLPRYFALNMIQRLGVDAPDLVKGLLDRFCRGRSPARLKLDVDEAIVLAQAFRKVGQPRQSLLVLRSQQGTYEAQNVRRERARALTDLGRDDAATRALGDST